MKACAKNVPHAAVVKAVRTILFIGECNKVSYWMHCTPGCFMAKYQIQLFMK